MPLLLLIALIVAGCAGSTVVTEQLGGRSDGLSSPATDTTSTIETAVVPTGSAVDADPESLIEAAVNGFFAALGDGDVAGGYELMAPQHRNQCTLEQAQVIGAEPTNENLVLEVVEYLEVPGGAIVTLRDKVDGSEMAGVGMVLFQNQWYVDTPLCTVLETYRGS